MAKFDKFKRAEFLRLLREEGASRTQAAHAVGVNRRTVFRATAASDEFAQQVSEAEMGADGLVQNSLFRAAVRGNVVACLAWLYSRQPDTWKDRRSIRHEDLPPNAPQVQNNVLVVDVGGDVPMPMSIQKAFEKATTASAVPMPVLTLPAKVVPKANGNGHHGD